MAKAQAVSGRHDDRVMAMLMCYWAGHDNEWIAGFDTAQERRRLRAAGVLEKDAEEESTEKPTWQNTAVSYGDMMEAWDDETY
jgi:hypothetical protein